MNGRVMKWGAWTLLAAFIALPLGAIAQNAVDQGQGQSSLSAPWRVQTTGGSSGSTTSSVNYYVPSATTTTLTGTGTACTAAGGAGCTIILASTQIIQWPNVAITIQNTDGADAMTNVLIEFSPDNTNWEVFDSTSFAGLAAGGILSMNIEGNARRYVRVEARAAVTVTSAVVTLTMNDG